MEFPQIVPSRRSVEAGDYPVKSFRSQNGVELRILYGDQRTNKKLTLEYNGIEDALAEKFYDHYEYVKGTFGTFGIGPAGNAIPKKGWAGKESTLGAGRPMNSWRYDRPPVITNIYPGVSNVSVSLVGVLGA